MLFTQQVTTTTTSAKGCCGPLNQLSELVAPRSVPGYEYVNVDDCWMAMNRTAEGKLTHDPVRFPSGMKALANYVQSRGLRFGLYSARCGKTCQGRPASQDHEWDDAFTFAGWDVDCEPCPHPLPSPAYELIATCLLPSTYFRPIRACCHSATSSTSAHRRRSQIRQLR